MADPRRAVPRTDAVLADPAVAEAAQRWGRAVVRRAVRGALQRVREGLVDEVDVVSDALLALPARPELADGDRCRPAMRRIINASGVLVHTNLGRAPWSAAAVAAAVAASGCTDVELDLATGRRGQRGRAATDALRRAVPAAEAVHVVNNGAAAVLLAVTSLAAGREVVVSRGELVEIGDGFRLPDLLVTTGARLREVGTTNRTTLADYAAAVSDRTGCILKVHPSNFVVSGFTATVPTADLVGLGRPVVVDAGSGLLRPDPALPDEPDASTALAAGATLVTCSGDKLLGGPQAGLLLGKANAVELARRHPLARALRVDKTTLAALAATVAPAEGAPEPPVARFLRADPAALVHRAKRLAERLRSVGVEARAVTCEAVVGGGGAPGVRLASAGVAVDAGFGDALRLGDPAVVARTEHGRALLDLRAVEPYDDDALAAAVRAAATPAAVSPHPPGPCPTDPRSTDPRPTEPDPDHPAGER